MDKEAMESSAFYPKLSVIILTYNQESMIERCLNSILLSDTKAVELVIADDCSKDNTAKAASTWLSKNSSFFYKTSFFSNPQNLGTVKNVIKAVSTSGGEYIKLLAGDDWFLDGALDCMIEYLSSHDFDVAFSKVSMAVGNENGEIFTNNGSHKYDNLDHFFKSKPLQQFEFLAVRNRLPAPAALFSRSFWKKINLSECELVYTEDWAMWLLGTLIQARFVQIDKPLVVYYEHNASVSKKANGTTFRRYAKDVAWTFENIILPNKKTLSPKTMLSVYSRYVITKAISHMPAPFAQLVAEFKKRINRR